MCIDMNIQYEVFELVMVYSAVYFDRIAFRVGQMYIGEENRCRIKNDGIMRNGVPYSGPRESEMCVLRFTSE